MLGIRTGFLVPEGRMWRKWEGSGMGNAWRAGPVEQEVLGGKVLAWVKRWLHFSHSAVGKKRKEISTGVPRKVDYATSLPAEQGGKKKNCQRDERGWGKKGGL